MGTRATVEVTLEIDVQSTWGNDCKLDQVYDQAAREAIGFLNSFNKDNQHQRWRIIGKPLVTAITSREK